ncbi:unnamed protein product [Cuscuta campestris]|uniref:Uncharacterized protein n=1 Tax=Cuscuta campestris TaxID=132261 RepID=A0A484KMM7_9ASTE|nr:unnamed protein product [Cuscuta campestris]
MGTKKKKLDMLGATGHLNLQSSDVLKLTMSSYEKQRLERIELNAAKMKALGLEEKARLLLKRHSELNNQKKLQNKKGKKALEGAEEHRPNNNVHDGKELDASDAIIDDKDLNNAIPQTIVRKNELKTSGSRVAEDNDAEATIDSLFHSKNEKRRRLCLFGRGVSYTSLKQQAIQKECEKKYQQKDQPTGGAETSKETMIHSSSSDSTHVPNHDHLASPNVLNPEGTQFMDDDMFS